MKRGRSINGSIDMDVRNEPVREILKSDRKRLEAVMGQPEYFPPEYLRPPAGPVVVVPSEKSAALGRPTDFTEDFSCATGVIWMDAAPLQLGNGRGCYPNLRWVQLPSA